MRCWRAAQSWRGFIFGVGDGGLGALGRWRFTANSLRSVWGIGPNDVLAVGLSGTVLRWNGSSWSEVTSGTYNALQSVWGSAANDVRAAGEGGTILRLRP